MLQAVPAKGCEFRGSGRFAVRVKQQPAGGRSSRGVGRHGVGPREQQK